MKTRIALLLACALGAPALQAMNFKWLEFSPVKYFDAKDWELLRASAGTALNEKEDGEIVVWRNEASGHHGSMKPVSRLQVEGRECRDLEIRNFAGGVNGGGTYRLCRMEDGDWKLLGGELGK